MLAIRDIRCNNAHRRCRETGIDFTRRRFAKIPDFETNPARAASDRVIKRERDSRDRARACLAAWGYSKADIAAGNKNRTWGGGDRG